MPSEIGRLISFPRTRRPTDAAIHHLIPRTVHDAFWQAHSEQQDYLVLFSYGADRCGVTLVSEYSLRGRIRQSFRRQEAESHRNAIEEAFLRRSEKLNQNKNDMTFIFQQSLIKATQLTLRIDCILSGNTSDLALQKAMKDRVLNPSNGPEVVSNAWRFCVYNALCPLYRVPLFTQSQPVAASGKFFPTLVLRDNPQRWKNLRDFLQQTIDLSHEKVEHMFQVTVGPVPECSHVKIIEALNHVIEIASVLFVLTSLFRRAPPLLVASGIQRNYSGNNAPCTVEDLLGHMNAKAHHILLDDILQLSNFDEHMDQELRTHLQHYCPDYFIEKKFLGVMKTLVVGEAPLDSSFRKLKLKSTAALANQGDCISFQNAILKLMLDHEISPSIFGNLDPTPRVRSDMNFCALLLGYTPAEYVPLPNQSGGGVVPQFWNLGGSIGPYYPDPSMQLWELCQFQKPGPPNPFPLLFLPPVRFICLQLCRVGNVISQQHPNWSNQDFTDFGNLSISQIYKQSLEQLLSMAFFQKMHLNQSAQASSEVGTALFHDAVEGALNLNDKKCTEMYVAFHCL